MASHREKCNHCSALREHTIRCELCHLHLHPRDRSIRARANNSVSHAAEDKQLRDLINTVSSNINTMVANMNGHMISSYENYRQQTRPFASLIPFSAHGRKRAVLCGVSYYGQKYKLDGTINDVKCMRYLLIHKLGFPSDSILVLSEEESNPSLIPTKKNMRKALQWLVQGSQSGDSLVFHYSGHGSQQVDFNGDEVDGYDEILWPVDHELRGKIVDDEINSTIVRPLPKGAKLHAIIDACHSGTILDLPFVCRMNRSRNYLWEDHSRWSATYKGTSGGLAVSISACDDHQVSLDTTALSGDASTGALTYSFIEAVQNEPGLTYGHLLDTMRKKIHEVSKRYLMNGLDTSLARKARSLQEPQLSSSEKFEIYAKQFVL